MLSPIVTLLRPCKALVYAVLTKIFLAFYQFHLTFPPKAPEAARRDAPRVLAAVALRRRAVDVEWPNPSAAQPHAAPLAFGGRAATQEEAPSGGAAWEIDVPIRITQR